MQLFVKGVSGRTLVCDVACNSTVAALKQIIQEQDGVPCDQVKLVCGLKELRSEDCLDSSFADQTVVVSLSLLGAGKKRKKKTYTKPKKIKHVHKKSKMGILKYYELQDGKVVRLRKECNDPVCPPATFMATHDDRYYCGRCNLTLLFKEKGKDPKFAKEKAPKAEKTEKAGGDKAAKAEKPKKK